MLWFLTYFHDRGNNSNNSVLGQGIHLYAECIELAFQEKLYHN